MRIVWAIATAAAMLCACTPVAPIRTNLEASDIASRNPLHECMPDGNGAVVDPPGAKVACADLVIEENLAYRMYVLEFDDQGWPYRLPVAGEQGFTSSLDRFTADLARIPETSDGAMIVVYVHGWRHNADTRDDNLMHFRHLLASLDKLEKITAAQGAGCAPRRVIGAYIGWRGLSLPDDIAYPSFWTRKNAAEKVGHGSAREVLTRIRAASDRARRLRGTGPSPCGKPIRSLIIGHSFGGDVVYTAVSAGIMRDVADVQAADRDSQADAPAAETPREGDIVIVINAAVEGVSYHALHRQAISAAPFAISGKSAVAGGSSYARYRSPLFISITSRDDDATRYAFPAGRVVSTLMERYAPDVREEEKWANWETLGQNERFHTHELLTTAQYFDSAPFRKLRPIEQGEQRERSRRSAEACATETNPEGEAANFRLFKEGVEAIPALVYPRYLCGGMVLVRLRPEQTGGDFLPIWNV